MSESFWGPVIVIGIVALCGGATAVLRGPIGKALAQWIASWSTPEHKAMEAKWAEVAGGSSSAPAEVAELREDLEELRRQLAETQERLDFAERLLAQQRAADRLAPPRV
jgi:hypothetical protein